MAIGPRAFFYRLRSWLHRREIDVWYDPAYRLPLSGIEVVGIEPRRADFVAHWLRESRAVRAEGFHAPEMKARLAGDGAEPVVSTPAEFGARIKSEIEKWSALAKAAKIQPEE